VRVSGWYWYEFEPRQCSYDASGAFPIDVEGSYLSIGIGPERGYGGQGYLDRQGAMDVPDTCGGTGHYDYDNMNHMWWKAYDTVEEAEQLVIDPSGRRISGSYISGGGPYTWQLTAANPE
jgi:hypothetical protein